MYITLLTLLVACERPAPKGAAEDTSWPPSTVSSLSTSPPVVAIAPEAPLTADALVARTTTDAAVRWAWTVDGVDARIDTATVAPERTARGQLWQVSAVYMDIPSEGSAGQAEVRIGNTPPGGTVTLAGVRAGDDLVATPRGLDPDGDRVTWSWSWTVDGSDAGIDLSTVSAAVTSPGQHWVVTGVPDDGDIAGPSVMASVTLEDAPPLISVAIAPEDPRAADVLTAVVEASDPDGQPVTLTYAWAVDGVDAGDGTTLASGFARDARVTLAVTASDGRLMSDGRADVVIGNTAPQVDDASILPERPATVASVTVDAQVSDADASDVATASWTWTVDGVPSGDGVLLPAAFEPGSRLVATVTASDGTLLSEPVQVETVVNHPPEVTLDIPDPERDGPIVADWSAEDRESDPLDLEWTWTVDGEPALGVGPLLLSAVEVGEVARVTLVVSDGRDATIAEAEYSPDNRAPDTPDVGFEPSAPLAGDAIRCSAEADDPDGDAVSMSTVLTLNGVAVETIGWLETRLDDLVVCEATASDGVAETLASVELVVGPPRNDNLLIILGDDMGTDKVAAYGEFHDPPKTPNLDALADEGVLFRNAYASNVCSPTRANLLTGRHGRRTGLAQVIRPYETDYGLSLDEHLLPEMLGGEGWSSALVGKWHLTGFLAEDPGSHALASGFEHHYGTLGNPDQTLEEDDVGSYYAWDYWTDGVRTTETRYLTTVTVDDALRFSEILPSPWVIFVSLNAPHAPYEPPPDELLSSPYDPDVGYWEIFDVMIEAMDTEVGRLLDGIDRERTTVVFAGDNGTPEEFIRAPWDPLHAKGTIYEPAINVPLIIAGPDVVHPGSESEALVHMVDIFGTAQHLAGVPTHALPSAVDSVSLLPHVMEPTGPSQRATVASEWFVPFDGGADPTSEMLAIRDERFKYVRLWNDMIGIVAERLYDLETGDGVPDADLDGPDLLADELTPEAEAAYVRLSAAADAHQALR